jgi:hypothetical protein
MRRPWIGGFLVLLAAIGLVSFLNRVARGADAPYAGTWRLEIFFGRQEVTLGLVKVEVQGGKPVASVLATGPQLRGGTLGDVSADASNLRFTFRGSGKVFRVNAVLPEGEKKPQTLLGSGELNGECQPMRLERTDLIDLDQKDTVKPLAGIDDLRRVAAITDTKEQAAGLKEFVEKHAGKPIALLASEMLLQLLLQERAPADDLRAAAEGYVKIAADYGRELERQALAKVAADLTRGAQDPSLALTYARRAAKQIRDDNPLAGTLNIQKILAAALRRNGRLDEAKEVAARINKMEEQLDQEYLRTATPFKPEPSGRTGTSGRVAVLELFTGAQCPPCVAADIAFDALGQTYKPAELALLQYHLHIPGPDALTNRAAEARAQYYIDDINGTPVLFLDGLATPNMGGDRDLAKRRYESLRKLVNEDLDAGPQARLELTVRRQGGTIEAHAEVSEFKKAGEKVRLRLALVEDVARYQGGNGRRLHHHVVRAFLGGPDGFPLKERAASRDVKITLADVEKEIRDYLAEAAKKRPLMGDEPTLRLERLRVVAFVQDDEHKRILQAAQADVPAAK